jgi:hypothetical protein
MRYESELPLMILKASRAFVKGCAPVERVAIVRARKSACDRFEPIGAGGFLLAM